MKLLLIIALLILSACGNKTKQQGSRAQETHEIVFHYNNPTPGASSTGMLYYEMTPISYFTTVYMETDLEIVSVNIEDPTNCLTSRNVEFDTHIIERQKLSFYVLKNGTSVVDYANDLMGCSLTIKVVTNIL